VLAIVSASDDGMLTDHPQFVCTIYTKDGNFRLNSTVQIWLDLWYFQESFRSGFLSVHWEIIGFNGTKLSTFKEELMSRFAKVLQVSAIKSSV